MEKAMRFITVFTVRIIYKGGATQDFDVTKFTISKAKDSASWEPVNATRPLLMGLDDIAAIWLVKERKVFQWWK